MITNVARLDPSNGVGAVAGLSGEDGAGRAPGAASAGGFQRWFGGRWPVPVLILAVLLAHGMALNADFYMDDQLHILLRETGKVAKGMHYDYRWVTGLAWDGLYGVFGASSVAFHAFNLLLHMLVTVSVYVVGRRLAGRAATAEWAALAGALIFATHPLLTEGVNYAQNASLQLVTLFTVWVVGCSLRFLDSAQPRWLWAAIGCLAASAFSKEVGIFYSGLSAALVWVVVGGRRALALVRSHRPRLPWCLLVAVPLFAYFLWFGGRLAFHAVQAPMWAENFFTQGRLFWVYLSLMLWPTGLCSDHLVPFSGVGWADPVSLAATLGVGALTVLLGTGLWWGRCRTVCLLVLMGLIPLLMRFLYINKELLVEYRTYPAMPWMALAAGWLVAPVLLRRPAAAGLVLAALVGTCAVASSRRSEVWSDASRLAFDAISRYPHHVRARTQLQKSELAAGNWDRVLKLRDETLHAFETLAAHNNVPAQRRKYELSAPYRGYMCSEHFVALALTERDGSTRGLAHAADILERHRQLHPEFFNPKNQHHEIVEQLVDVHRLLAEHGAAYDERRRSARAAPEGRQAAN